MAFSDQYCDLHGFSRGKPYFTAHDHGNCSIIRVLGCDSLATASEFQKRMASAAQSIGALVRKPNFSISITFERSLNNKDYVERMRRERQRDAQAKRLNANVLIEETLGVLKERLVHEEVLIACWTGLGAGYPAQTAEEFAQNRASWGRLNAKGAMDPLVAVQNLEGPHMGFVNGIMDALRSAKIKCELLGETKDGERRDLAAVRRSILFHETPENWSPQTTFERSFAELKDYETKDLSGLFAPPLAQQIMTSAGKATSDMRTVDFGGRSYAVVHVSIMPRSMTLFHLLSSKLERYDGHGEENMPWRYTLHLMGGVQISAIKDVFNTLAAFLSPMNEQKRLGNMEVKRLAQADAESFVGAQLMAATWVEPDESRDLLALRRARLVRAIESWNSPVVVEATTDPMRALAETCAGMTRRATIPKQAVAPVTEMSLSYPFHRTAPFFSKGQSVMISPEGKPIPLQAHSPDQNFWLTLISAPPGSGKSVFLNRTNAEFAVFTTGSQLPFIGVVDIGPSSSGFIELVRAMAPDHMRTQMLLVRLKNDRHDNATNINPFELGLGNRKPTDRERKFVEAFLTEILGDEDGRANPDFIASAVKQLYAQLSDLEISSQPKRWQEGMCPEIDALCARIGIPLHEKTRWWHITDALAEREMYSEAMMAQRYASPLLEDVARIVTQSEFRQDYGDNYCKEANLRLLGAIDQFPIFSRPTSLDIGAARICSIDLNDVVISGSQRDRGVSRNNALMYMIAAQLFLRQISGNEDDIPGMSFPDGKMRNIYRTYWGRRFQDIAETPKRFCMDEFHKTGSTPSIVNAVEVMAREGRKWGLEIMLASQKIDDFESFKELASSVVLLDATDNATRRKLQEQFGFSEAVVEQLQELHGPRPNMGAAFVIGAKLKTDYYWLRVYNHLAPTLLWALDTTPANRLLRKALVEKLGLDRALKLLVARFPRGTAVDFVEQWKADKTGDDEDFGMYAEIASSLIQNSVEAVTA
jgi:intracellular multiplication protein IcmB